MKSDFDKDEDLIECCCFCGALSIIQHSVPGKWECNFECNDCHIQYYEKPITKYMRWRFGHFKEMTNEQIKYTSSRTPAYYKQKSEERYGTPHKWHKIFVEEEVSKLPTFSIERYREYEVEEGEERRSENLAYLAKRYPEPIIPPDHKCPKCGSTNTSYYLTREIRKMIARGIRNHPPMYKCMNCGHVFGTMD